MANPVRGEVSIKVGDQEYTLACTLGAFAEIEGLLGVSGQDLEERLNKASFGDILRILLALFHGGGHRDLTLETVTDMPVNPVEAIGWVAEALSGGMLGNVKASSSGQKARPRGGAGSK